MSFSQVFRADFLHKLQGKPSLVVPANILRFHLQQPLMAAFWILQQRRQWKSSSNRSQWARISKNVQKLTFFVIYYLGRWMLTIPSLLRRTLIPSNVKWRKIFLNIWFFVLFFPFLAHCTEDWTFNYYCQKPPTCYKCKRSSRK